LVRRLCPNCKTPHAATEQEKQILGLDSDQEAVIYRAVGCQNCNQTGYKGRTGIHELLVVDENIRELIHTGAGEQAVEKAIREHTPSIREDGIAKVLAGKTTLEEILRVTRED
jgi:general secretion pathway protein E